MLAEAIRDGGFIVRVFLAGFVAGALFVACVLGWLSTMDDEVDDDGRKIQR